MRSIKVYIDKSMSTEKQRKTPVRWSDEDVNAVWAALPGVIKSNPSRGLTWQVEEAGKRSLGERWRPIPSFAVIPSSLLKRIADQYPSYKKDYPQLEAIVQLPLNKETFINLVVEARLTKPFEDFVDIWNESVALIPELGLTEVTHAKYLDQEMVGLIQKNCEAWLTPPPAPEPQPTNPPLTAYKSIDLLTAYHKALVKELKGETLHREILEGLDYEQAYIRDAKDRDAKDDLDVDGQQEPPKARRVTVPFPTPTVAARPPATRQQVLGSFNELPAVEEASDDERGRRKIRVTIVDHNVCRTPAEFERNYANHPRFKFKFAFCPIGSTGAPEFKQNGYAILSDGSFPAWKREAVKTCGHTNVFMATGGRESITKAMNDVVTVLEAKFPAPNNGFAIAK